MTEAYPLQWPQGRARTPAHLRIASRFDMTPDRARRELRAEAERHGQSVVISTNVELRPDGEPYANRRQPTDTGVAVYFVRKGRAVCFACDQYQRVWENMRAICKTLEAMRGIERWGSAEMLDRAFTGFEALPPPAESMVGWWTVLGVSQTATAQEIKDAWRAKCREAGGATLELNLAKETGVKI
ncbi:MAG: hypothetical protein JXQ79_10180 [Rhodobacteraceae bacterium]|nr:hypothetical protein [Paracoccaceae bacterium]